MKCAGCGVVVDADKIWVEFKCPGCNKEKLFRCERCKKLSTKYRCVVCGFSGP